MQARSLLVALVFVALALASGTRAGSAAGPPAIEAPLYAATVGGSLIIRGSDLGAAHQQRSITFSYDGASTVLYPATPGVWAWSLNDVRLTLPPEIRSGTFTVTVDGVTSAPASLLLYEYVSYPLPSAAGQVEQPLTLDIASDGRVWILEEGHTHVKWLRPATAVAPATTGKVLIPQPAGPGIFAAGNPPARTRYSQRGEDLDIAQDGRIWFTQGGAGEIATSAVLNTSRIVSYEPAGGTVACYGVPIDNAAAGGILIDEADGRIWYAESGLDGNALVSFLPSTMAPDCNWDPYTQPRPPVCAEGGPDAGCFRRYPLPGGYASPAHLVFGPDGAIWFTRFWANSVGRFDPATGAFITLPLPDSSVSTWPGWLVGGGPWELAFDEAGDLWVSEFFDGSLSRVRPAMMQEADCTQLDENGDNPCVEVVYIGSDGTDEKYLHSVTAGDQGRVWFSSANGIGLMSPAHDGAVAMFQPAGLATDLGGLREDPATGAVWFTQYSSKRVGVLRPAAGDADGVDDVADNCAGVFNPGQENSDRDFVDLSGWGKAFNDHTWPVSDTMGDPCDPDADNDGITNTAEASAGGGCASASGPTDTLVRDSDGDLVLDGAECMLGTDPASGASAPPRMVPGDTDRDGLADIVEFFLGTDPTRTDSDGDRLGDGIEVKGYGSNPLSRNTDADTCGDGQEAVSVNGDQGVNSIDLLIVAVSYGPAGAPQYSPAFDATRDGVINSGDLGVVATMFGPCRPA